MRHPVWRSARAVRLLVAVVALTPWLCNGKALFEWRDGAPRSPATAACGVEEWFWGMLLFAELLRLAWSSRRRRATVVVAGIVVGWLAWSGPQSSGLPNGAASGQATSPSAAAFTLRAPIAWDAATVDWELLAKRAVTLPAPPSARHWLGTDSAGRDLLARLLHGLRNSLSVGVAAAALALLIGVTVGLLWPWHSLGTATDLGHTESGGLRSRAQN